MAHSGEETPHRSEERSREERDAPEQAQQPVVDAAEDASHDGQTGKREVLKSREGRMGWARED